LKQLGKLLNLAEQTGLYLDITGLASYRMKDDPAWYADLSEQDRWKAQANFWEAVAKIGAGKNCVMAYDLINEPVIGGKPGGWVHSTAFAGYYYVNFIAADVEGRDPAEVWRNWAHTLISAIRKQDTEHLVTVGLLPLPNQDMLKGLGSEVDYMSVHIYPKKKNLDKDIELLRQYVRGKPVVVEEIFPMECSINELDEFIEKSRSISSGYIGFYWGKPMTDLKASKELGDKMVLGWLEYFEKKPSGF
jgi:hypothetical protein